LDGEVGKFVTIVRKKGNNWYLGAITNWNGRDITIDFSFLEKGKTFEADLFTDGLNAEKAAVDYKREKITVNSNTKMTFHLAGGGGLSAIITPK
jgi:alpha-glucosidase